MGRSKVKAFGRKKSDRQHIARERIAILLDSAEQQARHGDQELANRHAVLARKIGMRYQVTMPRGFKMRFCRQCQSYLVPGKNSRVRMTGGRLTRQCLKCGSYYRLPIGRK